MRSENIRRKSVRRKSIRRKSIRRKSIRRKSYKKRKTRKYTIKRGRKKRGRKVGKSFKRMKGGANADVDADAVNAELIQRTHAALDAFRLRAQEENRRAGAMERALEAAEAAEIERQARLERIVEEAMALAVAAAAAAAA